MNSSWFPPRLRILALMSAALLSSSLTPTYAQASPGATVYPGMEIRQDSTLCTLGFIDVETRTAYSAGHCHGSGQVTDKDGNLLGYQTTFRDNTPNGATIATDHAMTDWEAIALLPDVPVNNVMPSGRLLAYDPTVVPLAGDGRELRHRRRRQQRLVHDGERGGQSTGRFWRTGIRPHRGWACGSHRTVQQHLGAVPGGGVMAVHRATDPRGRDPAGVRDRGQHLRHAAGAELVKLAQLEHRYRRRGGAQLLVGRGRREPADVALDLPEPAS